MLNKYADGETWRQNIVWIPGCIVYTVICRVSLSLYATPVSVLQDYFPKFDLLTPSTEYG